MSVRFLRQRMSRIAAIIIAAAASTRQAPLPGYGIVQETSTTQQQIPGYGLMNEGGH